MCIRDRYTYILSYGFSIEYLYCKQPDAKKMQYGKAVSYTHLDVYKRQEVRIAHN